MHLTRCSGLVVVQTEEAFAAALVALRQAGVQLVPMDMGLVLDMADRDMPDELFYTYEMPRELSRWGLNPENPKVF